MGIFNFLSKKNELKDFFKIDIENIFKYNPQFSHSEKTESGWPPPCEGVCKPGSEMWDYGNARFCACRRRRRRE